jgi:hypothetical protein
VNLRPTSKRSRTALLALVAGTVIAVLVAAAVPTYSLNTRKTGPRDNRGFPLYYTDDRGLSLRLCEDQTARCLGAARRDLRPPEGEALYWAASATIRSRRGPIDVEFALEAAFGDAGRPIVFDRIRIRGHLRRAGGYVLLHPYGRNRFRAITPREQRNVNVTQDRKCARVRNAPCRRGNIDNFLRARKPPVGYVGWGDRLSRVKGGTVRNNLVLRTRSGKVIGQAQRFEIVGKRAGGLRNR